MKKTILMLMTASVLGISCSQKESVLRPEQEGLQTKLVGNIHGEKEEGMLLVKVTAEAQKDISEGIMEPYILAGGLEEASVEPVFPVSTRCDQTALRHGLDRWYTVKFDESISLDAAAQKLATNDAILAIEYNTFIERTEPDASLEGRHGRGYRGAAYTKIESAGAIYGCLRQGSAGCYPQTQPIVARGELRPGDVYH